MKIELVHRRNNEYPYPYYVESNEPNEHILDFLIYRKTNATFIKDNSRNANNITILNSAQRIVFLINLLAEQEYKINDKKMVGIDYRIATYEENIVPIINDLHNNAGWKASSLEQYVKEWRLFYLFLTKVGVEHQMSFPATIDTVYKPNLDDNFLSHTKTEKIFTGEKETSIPDDWHEFKDDYVDKVISMQQFWDLYRVLHKNDPVFAVLAFTQLTTFLRISALLNNFPLNATSNALNRHWKSYRMMKRDNTNSQTLFYRAKGGKTKSLRTPMSLMKEIHEEYITSEEHNYNKRHSEYKKNYCCTLWAKNAGRTKNMKPTWLTKSGTPVSVRTYQQALEDASNELGFKVHPHMLRHTGATQILWRYLKENNITASHTNEYMINDAHIILQAQLGHQSREVTRRYVKTVERMIQNEVMNDLLNKALSTSKKHHDEINNNPTLKEGLTSMERAIVQYEEFMRGRIDESSTLVHNSHTN